MSNTQQRYATYDVGSIKSNAMDSEISISFRLVFDLCDFDGLRVRVAERCSFDPFLYFNGEYGIIDREKLEFIFDNQIEDEDTYFNEDLDKNTKRYYRGICRRLLECTDPMWPLIFIQKQG